MCCGFPEGLAVAGNTFFVSPRIMTLENQKFFIILVAGIIIRLWNLSFGK
jgi:hypothetical protein